jgi:hypothetical protein
LSLIPSLVLSSVPYPFPSLSSMPSSMLLVGCRVRE